MQNYIEVAPAPLISHQRYSSCPKLETIVEEASTEKFETVPKSPIMFLLPVLFAFLSYSLLCRHVVWGGKFSLHRRERKCIRLVIWECLLIGTFRFEMNQSLKFLNVAKFMIISLSLSLQIYIYIYKRPGWNYEHCMYINECVRTIFKIHDKLPLSLSKYIYIYINGLCEIMNIICISMSVMWKQSS